MLFIFGNAVKPSQAAQSKTHNYSRCVAGEEYVFGPATEKDQQQGASRFCMTSTGDGVRCNDFILLRNGRNLDRFRVEQIEYYSEYSEMWSALLVQEAA
jgi:hypothetical protein